MIPDDPDNLKDLRRRMVAQQLYRRDIRDERVLKIMTELPRHHFIPPENRSLAYHDQPVSIGLGQTISQHYIVALMTEKLNLSPEHEVLEIGTGCGYQTAILANLCRCVYTIEVLPDLAHFGRANLEALAIDNLSYHIGNGRLGWPESRTFDRILIAAASDDVPSALVNQLAESGQMILPLGDTHGQKLIRLEKQGSSFREEFICYCRFVRLVHD